MAFHGSVDEGQEVNNCKADEVFAEDESSEGISAPP
jgi:hypothetical protein